MNKYIINNRLIINEYIICMYCTIIYSRNKFRKTIWKEERRGAASRQVIGALCAAAWLTNSFATLSALPGFGALRRSTGAH